MAQRALLDFLGQNQAARFKERLWRDTTVSHSSTERPSLVGRNELILFIF